MAGESSGGRRAGPGPSLEDGLLSVLGDTFTLLGPPHTFCTSLPARLGWEPQPHGHPGGQGCSLSGGSTGAGSASKTATGHLLLAGFGRDRGVSGLLCLSPEPLQVLGTGPPGAAHITCSCFVRQRHTHRHTHWHRDRERTREKRNPEKPQAFMNQLGSDTHRYILSLRTGHTGLPPARGRDVTRIQEAVLAKEGTCQRERPLCVL